MPETYDHDGKPVHHHMARVNGIRLHYITAGSGPPLLLLHGTPKNHYYWYRIIPYLTPNFTIIAPDLRGFGATDKPPASEGYDGRTNAKDMAELMDQLGHKTYAVHGEDRGGTYAFCLAGLYPDQVTHLSFCEMMLSDRLTEQSYFTRENIGAQFNQKGVWNWHIPFFWLPHVPEMLIQGKEEEFWTHFMKAECYNPSALDQVAVNEWVQCSKAPGGLRGILETYRSHWANVDVEKEILDKGKLKCKVMTVGAPEFFGPLVEEQMKAAANEVTISEVFEDCGHSLSLEQPERLSKLLKRFAL
ncbi:soluble epoxide hydrolase [Paraphoma chrysanthemicola]|nr:soluble epoxide hydrolase [Paraphoma chrysanthemicola]